MWFKYGLKAQKLLAQGIALGIMAISKAPCKGKSFVYCLVFEGFCPYRATDLRPSLPRAMPWARSFCPFRACGAYLRNLNKNNSTVSFEEFVGFRLKLKRVRHSWRPLFLAFYQPLLSLSTIHSLLTIYHQNHDE